MADTLGLVGAIGTWVAVLFAIIALAGIIPAYILYRESQTEHYEALSLVDDRPHEYISKGIALLPGRRFFRSIKVPNLVEPPELPVAAPDAPNANGVIHRIKRECDILDREGSPSLTSWINFANLLRAYGISPPHNGKLKIAGAEALLPIHRSWILLLGLVDRYGRRKDSGLFVEEPSDPEWSAFSSDALYGLSGILERVRPGRDRICFRMHSVAHMRSMPSYIPVGDIPPRTLFFLYLGYLPAPDGSLYCSAVESASDANAGTFVHRTTIESRDIFYRVEVLKPNEVPVRDRRLAEEMGMTLPTIRRLCLYKSRDIEWKNRPDVVPEEGRGLLDGVQYLPLHTDGETTIWLHPSETQSMIIAMLRLDVSEQLFLCGDDLKDFFGRLLPSGDMEYLHYMLDKGIDTLQIEDTDKEAVRVAIAAVANHPEPSTQSRTWAAALARLDLNLRTLRQKYDAAEEAVQTMAILALTKENFKSWTELDPGFIDPQAIFSIDVAHKMVRVPAISFLPPVEFHFDFPSVFPKAGSQREESEGGMTIPLWQVILASLHGYVKCNMWSTVFSSRDLSALHTQLNRIVYISPHDLPDEQEDLGERLRDVANVCREFTRLIEEGRKPFDEEEGGYDSYSEDDATGEPTEAPQMHARFVSLDDNRDDHAQSDVSSLQEPPDPDYHQVDTDGPAQHSIQDAAAAPSAASVGLTRKEQEERYLPALEQLSAAYSAEEAAVLTRGFRQIIGPIVLMVESLPADSLATLLGMSEVSILDHISRLQSAMSEPVVSAEPIQLVDISFRDFLLDSDSRDKHKFWVDEIQTHETIAMKCLELLTQPGVLCENVCGLEKPGQPRADITSQAIKEALPAHVQYACRYWVYHFDKGRCSIFDDSQVTNFLKSHFLRWLEALSLMGRVAESITSINTLRSLVSSESPQASLFLQDARRFALRNREAIDEAPLQLYSSAIMFLPQSSVIRSTFENHIPRSFRQLPVGNPTWDKVLLTLEGHYNGSELGLLPLGIETLAFSPDGTMLASGAADEAVIVWCAITGVILRKITRVGLIKGVAFSPDCSLLALARNDGFVSIHNLEKRLPVHTFKAISAYDGHVNAVVFSADGNFLATGASDGTITLWDRLKATRVRKFKGHSKFIFTLASSTDGLLATGSSDNTVKVWKFPSGKLLRMFDQFTSAVKTVGFTPHGTLLMASDDGSVKTWDLKDSADVRTLISSDEHEQGQYNPFVSPIFLSPSGKLLAMPFKTTVELRDTASGEKLTVVQGHLKTANVLAFSPDDTMLAAANDSEPRVEIWELSQEEVPDLSLDFAKSKASETSQRPLVFSPNGNILASGNWDTINLWDPMTGTVIRSSEFERSIDCLTFSPNSEALAFACGESMIISDLLGGNGIKKIRRGYSYGRVSQLAFSPDCKILAEASRRCIRLWDIATRSAQQKLPILDALEYIAFSSDGKLLASTLHNGMIQRWLLPTGMPLTTLTGHTRPAIQVTFSSDNKMLASASIDETITLWDWATGTALQTFHADIDTYITDLSFHDNDTRLGTNLEVFALDGLPSGEPYKVSLLPKFGLNNNWIMRDDERVLWLPPDHRATVVVSYGHRVALLLESGRVVFIAWDS